MTRLAAAFAVIALVAGGCSSDGGRGGSAAGTPASTATTTAPALDVASFETEFIDATRERTLRTIIHHPDGGDGPFPLVVISHGLGARPEMFARLASHLAANGYVVAAPEFPLTTSGSRSDITDVNNQPADVSFVIDEVVRLGRGGEGPIAGLVDVERIAAAGHSLGGITTLLLGYHPCCQDERVDAAVVMAGGAVFGTGDGQYFDGVSETPPLLMLHGDQDQLVKYSLGRSAYEGAAPPKYLVTFLGGDHVLSYFMDRGEEITNQVVLDFLDGYVKGDDDALDRLERDAQVEGVSTLASVSR